MVVRLRVLCDGDKVNGPTLCLVRSVAEPWDDFAHYVEAATSGGTRDVLWG
jgi:hypothetical protein